MNYNRFVGMSYDRDSFDCADFVALVQREGFSRGIHLPGVRPRGGLGSRHFLDLSAAYAEPTQSPVDGDLVLMYIRGLKVPTHAGVYLKLAGEVWVLHCSEDFGTSVIQRERELVDQNTKVEGFYRWLTT